MSTAHVVRALRVSETVVAPASGVMRTARKAPSVAVSADPLDAVLAGVAAAPGDAYWARRLIDLVRDPMSAWRLRSHLVSAVCAWARHDVSFFVHERYLSEQLAVWTWPREVFDELELTLRLDDPSLTHLVMGRLWLEARRDPQDLPHFYAHSARHLRAVSPEFRIGSWAESMGEALGVADPNELARSAGELLGAASSVERERVVLAILRGAARAGDWTLYDAHRRAYGTVDADGNLRANRELAELDYERAEQDMVVRYIAPSFEEEDGSEPTAGELMAVRLRMPRVEALTTRPPAKTRSET